MTDGAAASPYAQDVLQAEIEEETASSGFLGKLPYASLLAVRDFLGERPTLSLGAGVALNESFLLRLGADIIATDIASHAGVEQLDALVAVERYHSRCDQLFFCWPPPFSPFPHAALLRYRDVKGELPTRVVYVGEGRDGMTGDADFHNLLEANYRLVRTLETIRFEGVEDDVFLYELPSKNRALDAATGANGEQQEQEQEERQAREEQQDQTVSPRAREEKDPPEDTGEMLRLACSRRDVDRVRELVGSCAAADLTRALFAAAWNGPLESVRLLLGANARVDQPQQRGRHALHLAAQAGLADVCTALIDAGAAADLPCSLGLTPYGYADEFGHPDAARAIRRGGGGGDHVGVHATNAADRTRLPGPSHSGSDAEPPLLADALHELAPEFAAAGREMAPPLRRLIVANADPASVPVAAVVHALKLPFDQYLSTCDALAAPAAEALLHVRRFLDAATCAALRAAVDADAARNADSVDRLIDHQYNVPTEAHLHGLIGTLALQRLRQLPREYAATGGRSAEPLRIQSVFVRRYATRIRPWLQLHQDQGPVTVNVALSGATHEGGRLLGLFDGAVRAIERDEGDATVHCSTLLHGVSCMHGGGARYSLIVFFERDDGMQSHADFERDDGAVQSHAESAV